MNKFSEFVKKNAVWLIICAVVVVVGLGVIIGVLVGNGKSNKKNSEIQSDSETISVGDEIDSLDLDKTFLELEVGTSVPLTVSISPESASETKVIWSSSDDSVAVVRDGEVIGKKDGTVTITASAGGESATCEVTVFSYTVLSELTIDNEKIECRIDKQLKKGDKLYFSFTANTANKDASSNFFILVGFAHSDAYVAANPSASDGYSVSEYLNVTCYIDGKKLLPRKGSNVVYYSPYQMLADNAQYDVKVIVEIIKDMDEDGSIFRATYEV